MTDSVDHGSMPTERRSLRSNRRRTIDGNEVNTPAVNGTHPPKASARKPIDIATITDEMIHVEKQAVLEAKQTELDRVFNRHDDLVRERFHMDNYQTLLTYHPSAAKEDNSHVFQEYKSTFDLMETAEPIPGPSRQTRRVLNERKKLVTTTLSSLASSSATPSKGRKRKAHPEVQVLNHEIWNILNDALEKGKGKAVDERPNAPPEAKAEEKTPRKRKSTTSTAPSPKRVRKGASLPPQTPSSLSELSELPDDKPMDSVSALVRRNTPGLNGVHPSEPTMVPDSGLDNEKSQKTNDVPIVLVQAKPTSLAAPASIPTSRALRSNKDRRHSITSLKQPQPTPEALPVCMPPTSAEIHPSTTAELKPKRIKLVVRRPPPIYTNPGQIPFPPKHGGSLSELNTSYKTNGGKDVDQQTLQRRIIKEAEIRDRELSFRRRERFIPGTDIFFGTKLDIDAPLPPRYEPPRRTTTDHWDSVIEAAVANGKERASRKMSLGRQVASQVASRVQAYWDAAESRKEKIRVQEEKRLRALAKITIKQVIAEWKKAVFYIREQERLKEEAEERRRGREHLDAILDQSGQLLSTQQQHLTRRGSSRGSSVHWDADLDDEEDEETEEEDVSEKEEEEVNSENDEDTEDEASEGAQFGSEMVSESEDDDDSGLGTSMLLMGGPYSPRQESLRHKSSSPTPETQLTVYEDTGQDSDDESVSLGDILIPDPETSPISPPQPLLDSETAGSPTHLRSSSPTDGLMDKSETPLEPPKPSSPAQLMDIDEEQPLAMANNGASAPLVAEGDVSELATEELMLEETVVDRLPEVDESSPGEHEDTGVEEPTKVKESRIPAYLKPYAVAPVEWDPSEGVKPPSLMRGVLRPYQQSGLEWLASLHTNNLNGILADEMGLGKTIQTIALLAHLACDRGIWGPHLIVVPTSVLLNWEMEFKKFLPGFKILSYHGSPKRRKELRLGWTKKYKFNVCITSYALASRDQRLFKRKAWYYMILDEAHMIKNFRSQRWNTLLMFRSFRRLLLTGTPLQNNLTELWALLQFLMSGSDFANLKEFGDWFANPLERAIETGDIHDEETVQRVTKLHTVLRPYLLRRLKRDVEKELPSKFEHLVLCHLSRRQRFLYDEFMSRAQTKQDLDSGVYQKIANILMQLRKVCNHPDLFEVRPIVSSFAMSKSAVADFEIKELLIRRRWCEDLEESMDLDLLGLRFTQKQNTSRQAALETLRLDATSMLPYYGEVAGVPPAKDTRTVAGFRQYAQHLERAKAIARWSHICYLNRLRCSESPIYSRECIDKVQGIYQPLLPLSLVDRRKSYMDSVYQVNAAVLSYTDRQEQMAVYIDRFAFVTPPVIALDLPRLALANKCKEIQSLASDFDALLHRASVKLQIAFPDRSLLQYDCGKLQRLAELLHEKKAGGHRVLIFTQMTRILDVLEMFLSFHGYLYLRLDGATKIEDRHYITERFNADSRIFCFISSSRSGGVGINLTGADTVVFYDSDFNPQMDRQCEDRAHRIGQIRDVHIYRFVSQYTVEEAMLRKANQKRSLDDLVIQQGEFDWRMLFKEDDNALTRALGEYDDAEDALAAAVATKEAFALEGADEADFEDPSATPANNPAEVDEATRASPVPDGNDGEEDEEEGGTTVDYMVAFVKRDYEFFRDWRL